MSKSPFILAFFPVTRSEKDTMKIPVSRGSTGRAGFQHVVTQLHTIGYETSTFFVNKILIDIALPLVWWCFFLASHVKLHATLHQNQNAPVVIFLIQKDVCPWQLHYEKNQRMPVF